MKIFYTVVIVLMAIFANSAANAVTTMTYDRFTVFYPDSCFWQAGVVQCKDDNGEIASRIFWTNPDNGHHYTQKRQARMAGDSKWRQQVIDSMNTRMREKLNDYGVSSITFADSGPIKTDNGIWMTVGYAVFNDDKSMYLVQIWDNGRLGEFEILHDNTEENHNTTKLILNHLRYQ